MRLHGLVALLAGIVVIVSCTASEPPTAAPAPSATGVAATSAAASPRAIYVDPNGDDRASGAQAQPLKTLPAAQAAARQLLSREPRVDVQVVLKSGTYALEAPLRFDARDTPGDPAKLTFSGPSDASAVVTSGRRITAWEPVGGGLYRSRLASGWRFNTMWENGEQATLARSPNAGYAAVAGDVGPSGSTSEFLYAAGDVPDDLDLAGARVYVWSGVHGTPPRVTNHDWEVDIVPVKAVDRGTRKITLADTASYAIQRGNRYVLQGSRTLIDRPGEFAIDADGFVLYRPRREPIEQQQILAPAASRLIEAVGTAAGPVRNIVFERLTFTGSDFPDRAKAFNPARDNAAIHLENAENVVVHSSKIVDVGGSAVILRGNARGNRISGNLIERFGVHGVWLSGTGVVATPVALRANVIQNNRIRRGGLMHGSGSGVKVEHSAENEIVNNEISELPRYGVSLKGTRLEDLVRFQPQAGATEANWRDLVQTRGNVVRGNDISRVLLDSQDAGGIEMWGAQRSVVEGNRVHDIRSGVPDGLTHAIYLDDWSDYAMVRRNVVYGIDGPGASSIMLKGIYNEFTNNVVITGSAGGAALFSYKFLAQGRHDHLTLTRNIFYRETAGDIYWFGDWSDDRLTAAGMNLLYNHEGTYRVRFRFGNERLTLDEWRARYGFDRDSLTEDPRFVDPARGDYSVRPDSPALRLGFVNIDQSAVGLRQDFAFGR